MERESTGPVSESKKLLALSVELLGSRDFTSCRRLALRVQKSDPEISVTVNRIIAIADVLKASKRRLPNKIHDWYSILQLRRVDCENCHIIRTQFKNLLHLLNPNKNKFPFSEEAFMLVRNAWFVLSDPGKKAKYESDIDKEQEICNQREDKQESFVIEQMGRYKENGSDSNATFWTVCPYCWNLYEYEKVYEECGLRCQNCKKAFHGVAVNAPAPEMLVEGKEQYYCCHGYFRMRYSGPQHKALAEKQKEMTNKKKKHVGENGAGKVFVEISDDDSDDSFNGCGNGEQRKGGTEEKVKVEGLHEKVVKNVSNEAQGTVKSDGHGVMEGSGMSKLQNMGKRRMKVKTVARSSKKITGNRMKSGRNDSPGVKGAADRNLDYECGKVSAMDGHAISGGKMTGSVSGCDEGELEFFDEDGDILVGIRYT